MLTREERDPKFQYVCQEACRLINLFDQKPLLHKCGADGCSKPATRLGIAEGGYEIRYWCDDCRPRAWGGFRERVDVVHNFLSALYLETRISTESFQPETPIFALAYAKGLSKPFADRSLVAFFNDEVPTRLGMLPGEKRLEKRGFPVTLGRR
jgi:hypothetical protein